MATTTQTTVTLPDELAARINRLVADGSYASPEEAVSSLILNGLNDELISTHYTLAAKARVEAGIEASLRGEVVHHDEVEAYLDKWEREL